MPRRFADCGHACDGATDSGWCHGCEEAYREQERLFWEQQEAQREFEAQQHDDGEATR